MSTVSGVFPNAITPTFAATNDPAAATRLRRENETIVFSPVEELEQNAESRAMTIAQPGRLEAEQNVRVSSQEMRSGETAELEESGQIAAGESLEGESESMAPLWFVGQRAGAVGCRHRADRRAGCPGP